MMILDQMIVGMMGVCCYIVACPETKKGIVIDPGGDAEKILGSLQEQDIELLTIVNTHGHPDHVCANGPLKKATGAQIAMHEADADFFERPDIIGYFASLGLPASPPVDRRLQDGDRIDFGTLALQVIHTPGHTPGGICLYRTPDLFTGDSLFVGGVGRTDFPGGSTSQLMQSIRSRLLALPAETVVWPGHGYGGLQSTIGEEKRTNPFLLGVF
jgi:hydroxyacylglutathione hydrolase